MPTRATSTSRGPTRTSTGRSRSRISTPTGSRWRSRRTGEQLQPPDDHQPQQWVAGPRWQRPDEPARPARRLTVSQGRLASESGQANDPGIPGGQVTVTWDDFGANESQLMANTISPGRDYSFGDEYGSGFFGGLISPRARRRRSAARRVDRQHHRPEYPRRHGQHRRLQRCRPGPVPDRPQRRYVHPAPEPGPLHRGHGRHRHRDQRRQPGGRDLYR